MPATTLAPIQHRIQLLQGSRALFAALIEAMDAARREIRLETYIFDLTGGGAQVAQALMRAARRGVAVWLVVDGVGTGQLPQPWRDRLVQAGVQLRVYSPLGRLGLLIPSRWRRLHRKLCVVDGRQAFCGGINILDDFYDPNHGPLSAPRFDFAVSAYGGLVQAAQDATGQLWWRMQAVQQARQRNLKQAYAALRTAGLDIIAWQDSDDSIAHDHHGIAQARLVLRDNVRHRSDIERAYRAAISGARHEIVIANAYFLPGRKLRKALLQALARGVTVRLLLQGRYEYFMQYHAARPFYDELLKAGAHIHEYAASFLHAKVAAIDANGAAPWATVGSSNLDPLSVLLAREANVVVRDHAFAQDLRGRLMQAMASPGCQTLDATRYANRPLHARFLDHLAYALMRTALFVTGKRY